MKTISMSEFRKEPGERILDVVRNGDSFLLTKQGKPVAVLVPVEPVGPISPRDARDEAEGEAVAPSEPGVDYCPATWRKNERLICTRYAGHDDDHVVGHDGKIIARWPQGERRR